MQWQYQCLCFALAVFLRVSQSGLPCLRLSLSHLLSFSEHSLLPSFNFIHSYTLSVSSLNCFSHISYFSLSPFFFLFSFPYSLPSPLFPSLTPPDFLHMTMIFALNEIHANEDLKFDNLSPFSGFSTIQRQSSAFAIPGFPEVIAPHKRLED